MLFYLFFSIPIFFLIKYILRKLKIEKPTNRTFISFFTALILVPLTYITIFSIIIFSITYSPEKEFDQDKWSSDPDERYEMTKDIIESKMLEGMTKEEIINLLGNDDFNYNEDHWAYGIGFVPGLFNIDPSVLNVHFENNKVVLVTQHET